MDLNMNNGTTLILYSWCNHLSANYCRYGINWNSTLITGVWEIPTALCCSASWTIFVIVEFDFKVANICRVYTDY